MYTEKNNQMKERLIQVSPYNSQVEMNIYENNYRISSDSHSIIKPLAAESNSRNQPFFSKQNSLQIEQQDETTKLDYQKMTFGNLSNRSNSKKYKDQ